MSGVLVIDREGPMVTISRDAAYVLESKFEIAATGNPNVYRFLTPQERQLARRIALARVSKAHKNDIATEADFIEGGRFDAFVAEIKEF